MPKALSVLALLLLPMTNAFAADPPNQKKIDAQIKAIKKSAILIDTHTTTFQALQSTAPISGKRPRTTPIFRVCARAA